MSQYAKKLREDKREELSMRVTACADMDRLGWGPPEGDDKAFLEALLPHHAEILELISKTNFEDVAVAEYGAHLAKKLIMASSEIRKKLSPPSAMPSTTYELEVPETEFAGLPPFLKVGIIKGLEKKLAAEKDPNKKSEIQAKIDKLKE